MAAEAPRWTRLQHDERRDQILACARRLFSERHYGAVSMEQIAREAGVARGLLHHYFGSKRELYLEVVRSMLTMPPQLFADAEAGRDPEEALGAAVDRYIETVRRNRKTWLAAAGALGFGHDPELEAIVEEGREQAAERAIALLGIDPSAASRELRALVRAYSGFVEGATLEWMQRRRITREQLRELLLQGLLHLVRDVLPQVERAGTARRQRRSAA
jgi:AcrR family transcriptional regulator